MHTLKMHPLKVHTLKQAIQKRATNKQAIGMSMDISGLRRLLIDSSLTALLVAGILGCDSGASPSSGGATGSNPTGSAPAKSAPAGPNFGDALRKAATKQPEEQPQDTVEPIEEDASEEPVTDEAAPADEAPVEEAPVEEAPPEREMVSEVAAVGASKKAQAVKGGGIISEPVRAFFRTGDRIVFDISLPNAMKTYKALNDNKGPTSHEVFMEKIIQENEIELPTLPEGHVYRYDPETDELMIDRPK